MMMHGDKHSEVTNPELFRQAMYATERSMVMVDVQSPDAPVVFVNPAFERLTGYSAEEVLGKNLRFLQGALTDSNVLTQIRLAMLEKHPTMVTLINYRKDGSTFWNEVTMSPVYDDDGVVRHFVAVHSDVTAKVLSQRDLEHVYASERLAHSVARSASDRLEAILAQMPAGVLIASAPSGELLRGNAELERIFRHPFIAAANISEYARYESFHENGERIKGEEWPLARALHGETVTDQEMVISRGDGTSGIILVRATPVHDEENKIVAAVALFEDITERKRQERQLAKERERSWALAATLQKSLLPPALPEVHGLEFGAAYTPVAEGLDVGGDFYDFFTLRDGSWAVVIGDVMGKGAEAASITSLARHVLRTAGLRSRRPSTLLGILNQALLREGEDNPFLTVAAAVLSQEDYGINLSIGLGGHPRPFILRVDGTVELVGEPGTLMGVVSEVDVFDIDISMVEGDTLILYTDGATEAHNDDRFLGEEGLMKIVQSLGGRNLSASDLAQGIQEHIVAFLGASLKDDLALLVVKVKAPAEEVTHL